MKRTLPSPAELMAYLNRFVYGQHEAKRTLCTAAYKHYLGLAESTFAVDGEAERLPAFGRQHTLLVGDTGSGKTLLIRHLADVLDVPVAFCRATSLVEAGYVGEQVESLVASLLAAANNNVDRAERGIIFIDEIDKIRRTPEVGRDVSGEGVQNALLALLDGNEVRIGRDGPTRVNTSRVLFLAAGAFTGIERIVRRRDGGMERVGFGVTGEEQRAARPPVRKQDLIDFGMIPELVGRFTHVRQLERLGTQDLTRILDEVEDSILARTRHYFTAHDIDLRFTDAARRAIAAEAERMATGARGLDSVVGRVLEPLEWELIESSHAVQRVLVTANTVLHGHRPQVRYDPNQPASAVRSRDNVQRLRERAFVDRDRQSAFVRPDPIRLTNTQGWSDEQIRERIGVVKTRLAWDDTAGSARKWWEAFEQKNHERTRLVLRLAEELLHRKATITDFFLSYVYSNTDNIQANLHYLDYIRLKKAEERKKKEAAQCAEEPDPSESPHDDDPVDDLEEDEASE